jgi:hypothetical protein
MNLIDHTKIRNSKFEIRMVSRAARARFGLSPRSILTRSTNLSPLSNF